jgi:hypothetical protein
VLQKPPGAQVVHLDEPEAQMRASDGDGR